MAGLSFLAPASMIKSPTSAKCWAHRLHSSLTMPVRVAGSSTGISEGGYLRCTTTSNYNTDSHSLIPCLISFQSQNQFQMETQIKPKETRKFVFTSVSAIAQAGSRGNEQLTEQTVINQFDCAQFISLLEGLLTFDPMERARPEACLQHPFITMHHLSMYTNCLW